MDNQPNTNRLDQLPRPESMPVIDTNIETGVGGQESAPSPAGERVSQAMSAVAQIQQANPVVVPVTQPTTTSSQAVQSQQDDNTIVAEDKDVIEKIWIAKAKKIIDATKDDPKKRSDEFLKMRREYLLKRYGKDLVSPDENM